MNMLLMFGGMGGTNAHPISANILKGVRDFIPASAAQAVRRGRPPQAFMSEPARAKRKPSRSSRENANTSDHHDPPHVASMPVFTGS